MKKNIIFLLFIISNWSLNAQVAIEKTSLDGSSILDFPFGTTKGIILPALTTIPAEVNGSLGLYRGDGRVYMRQNNIWVPLTEDNGNLNGLATLINNPSPEAVTTPGASGVIIGATTSAASGVLVLESSTLALTLPNVNDPSKNVKSPYPGMICYDTASKSVAVFDGKYWNYWK